MMGECDKTLHHGEGQRGGRRIKNTKGGRRRDGHGDKILKCITGRKRRGRCKDRRRGKEENRRAKAKMNIHKR